MARARRRRRAHEVVIEGSTPASMIRVTDLDGWPIAWASGTLRAEVPAGPVLVQLGRVSPATYRLEVTGEVRVSEADLRAGPPCPPPPSPPVG